MKMICRKCKKEFSEKPARVKIGKGKYCSKKCYVSIRRDKFADRQFLIAQYLKGKKTMRAIAQSIRCSPSSVGNWLRRYGFQSRDVHDRNYPAGENHPRWKGGFFITKAGYKILRSKALTGGNPQYEHRRIMEAILGRKLKTNEIIHHVNGDKLNNDPENLTLMTRSEHTKLHKQLCLS